MHLDIPPEAIIFTAGLLAGLVLGLRRGKSARDKATLKNRELRRELRDRKKQLTAITAALR